MTELEYRVNKNERSWAIELISQINQLASSYDLIIKRAGGESTISNNQKVMFPDVILYNDRELRTIIQGWEIKMPDVPITDSAFINDAQRKARALKLTSCVTWNFSFATFYVLDPESDSFDIVKEWENPNIQSREDVASYREEWEHTLKDVVLTVNAYLIGNNVASINVGDIISQNAIDILINDNKTLVSDGLKSAAIKDSTIAAAISAWWEDVKQEYSFDETDKYNAYAKTIILNWAYRIIFAHLIKRYQNSALAVNQIAEKCSPSEANTIFSYITKHCDFYNIFAPVDLNEIIPDITWYALIELSTFLRDNGISYIDQSMLQNILEKCVNVNRRLLNGQYTTPRILAEILSSITVHDLTVHCIDPCCGTGTIISEILKKKKAHLDIHDAISTTWASDKYRVPLQIASLSLASSETINEANIIFQKNALSIKIGDVIGIVDPQSGDTLEYTIPKFGAICSNLPFLPFESIPDEDKALIVTNLPEHKLDSKSDLSYYIAVYLKSLIQENGYLGIILSNAWLGTNAGAIFYNEITSTLDLLQVHISGAGRWFKNADVVVTLLIFQNKKTDAPTNFFVWKKPLEEIESSERTKQLIINSSLLNRSLDQDVISISTYQQANITAIHNLGLSYNSLFNDINWVIDIMPKLCSINSIFKVFRGSRRGWDPLFFPEDTSKLESKFLRPALFNARKVEYLFANPDKLAFSCSEPLDVLEHNYKGAYKWIMSFSNKKNKVGILLPRVLKRGNEAWYEMKPNEVTELFTMMNPDDRIFFGRFHDLTFINQRLIGFKKLSADTDIELCHALLNTILVKFFIEAVGFGRGQGVLDINKDNIATCLMLNPNLLDDTSSEKIKEEFKVICSKPIFSIETELADEQWIHYNHTVLEAFGIEQYYELIVKSLTSMRKIRKAVKN